MFSSRVRLQVKPPKVLVLSMNLHGGPLAQALKKLGYHPYTYTDTYRKGHVMTHPIEWKAILRGEKKNLELSILSNAPTNTGKKVKKEKTLSKEEEEKMNRPYDCLVGPPATLAFETILQGCPRSTKVILVEEVDKLLWEKESEAEARLLLKTLRLGRLTKLGRDLYEMTELMFGIKTAVVRGFKAHQGDRFYDAGRIQSAIQTSSLGLGGSLDLFEEHVKSVVPRDRLLVYHVQEGWGPLCRFLGLPLPCDPSTKEVEPFPTASKAWSDIEFLDSSLRGAKTASFFVFLFALAFLVVLLTPFFLEIREVSKGMQQYGEDKLRPHKEAFMENPKENYISSRRVMIIAKRAYLEYLEQLKEKDVTVYFTNSLKRLAGHEPKKEEEKN